MDSRLELFLQWGTSGDAPVVRDWLEQRGLAVMQMKHGLLISGSARAVERAFAVELKNQQLPYSVPVPSELAPHVASIILPKPRSYQ